MTAELAVNDPSEHFSLIKLHHADPQYPAQELTVV